MLFVVVVVVVVVVVFVVGIVVVISVVVSVSVAISVIAVMVAMYQNAILLLLLLLLKLVSSHIQNVRINEIQSWNYLDYYAFKPTPLSVVLRHINDVTTSIIDAKDTSKFKEYGIVKYKVKLLTNLYNLRYYYHYHS